MSEYDKRLTPIRDGVAARALEGVLPADRYVDPMPRQCALPAAAIRREPSADAWQDDQLLFGEVFDVLFSRDGFGFGQARRDGYCGWVALDALTGPIEAPTHRVAVLRTYGFSRPDIMSPPIGLYSINSLVTIEAREGRFAKAVGSGWFVEALLAPVGVALATDPASVAESFVGAAYQWGGRESLGLDCSGLVQQALAACGKACPRDSDMQQAALGRPVEDDVLRRGDLVFWSTHVGMMLDDTRLLHATGHHLAVVIEPLAEVAARFRDGGFGEPTAYRRL
jgi:cell wall-associated NlpC family hydrolase